MIYDRKITIDNIKCLMKEKHITQTDFAKALDSHQSKISDFLNDRADLTVPQLVSAASFLGVSIDSLIGIKQEKTENKFETYSDIFRLLFSLGELFDIGIIDIMASDVYDEASFDYRFDTVVSQGMDFSDETINKILKEWKTFLDIKEKVEYWEEPYKSWKEGVLSRYNVKIKNDSSLHPNTAEAWEPKIGDGFMNIPDEELPFS